jgi:tetratricopeptide (TPR) repeat protein
MALLPPKMPHSLIGRRSSSATVFCGLLTLAVLATGCETTGEQTKTSDKKPAAEPKAPPPPRVDAAALCEMHAVVDDAIDRGAREAIQKDLAARTEGDADALAYGRMLAIENDKERWEAFKRHRNDNEGKSGAVVGNLGECLIYNQWKMPDQAKMPCERVQKAVPKLALVDVASAELAVRRGDLDGAQEILTAARDNKDACVPVLVALGRVEAARGDDAAAIASYQAAEEIWPACFGCLKGRADLVAKTDGEDAAIPLWESALKLVPDDASTLQRYAAALVGKDDNKALVAYETAIETGAATFETLVAAAALAEKLGDTLKAIDYAEQAARVQTDSVDNWRRLARLYESRKEQDSIDRAYGEILRLLPDDVAAHAASGKSAQARGEYLIALDHYQAVSAQKAPEGEDEATATIRASVLEAYGALKTELNVLDPGPTGNPNRVVNRVQSAARVVYERQLKTNRRLKGTVALTVRTKKDGTVENVQIQNDTLQDALVVASVVGNLKVSNIDGGAQRLSLELAFE